MPRKNYASKLAFAVTIKVLVPINAVLDFLLSLLLLMLNSPLDDLLLIFVTFLICTIVSYFILFIVGCILFKHHDFRQDDNCFYQGRIKLPKKDLDYIFVNRIIKVYLVRFVVKNHNAFTNNELLYYFATYEELVHFLQKNALVRFVPPYTYNELLRNHLMEGVGINKEGKMKIMLYPCPCCGNFTYTHKPSNNYYICPVCFFEEDKEAILNPNQAFDLNKISLNEAKRNYLDCNACSPEFTEYVRKPFEYEIPKDKQIDKEKF